MADLAPEPYNEPQWLISDYDFTLHAFHHAAEQDFLEGLCEHSVPPDKTTDPKNTTLVPDTCVDCLKKFGEAMASRVQKWHD